MKTGALHREWALWNQILVANSKLLSKTKNMATAPVTATQNETPHTSEHDDAFSEKCTTHQQQQYHKIDSPYCGSAMKEQKVNGDGEGDNQLPTGFKRLAGSPVFRILLLLIPALFYFTWTIGNTSSLPNFSHNCGGLSNEPSIPFMKNLPAVNPFAALSNSSKPHEVIDIPYFPDTNISSPVYTQVLLQESFASSWNRPVLVKYTPPPANITYKKVVLTLETTVNGVQYDRLVHIYLNDNEIWRSSTIEPAGRLTHSFAQRDATMYYKLFTQPGDLLVQLDNLVTPKLTGAFNITLSAVYLNEEENLRTSKHPDIIPLTPSRYGSGFPPIVYYPNSKLSVSLPVMNFNTTELILLLTTSANAAEEFWSSNLLDQYRKAFLSHNRHFYGHGSCRVINVFVNGIRVHTTNPKPYLFTGGIAPTLWQSIVSTGSFNIVPYYVDLTPVLPLLWDSSAHLEIDISNCIDDDEKAITESGIGSNWITSASLAVWEDSSIEDSYSEVETFDNSTAIKTFAISPPSSGFLTQIIKASYANSFQTNITYTYINGTESSKLTNYTNEANQTSLIVITKFGDTQSLISVPRSSYERLTLDPETSDTLKTYTMLTNSSMVTHLDFLSDAELEHNVYEKEPNAQDISFNVSLVVKENTGAYKDAKPLFEIISKENGTAEFTISAHGNNHGTGSMLHNYSYSDIRGRSFTRVALADNDEIVYDNLTDNSTPRDTEIEANEVTPQTATSLLAEDLEWLNAVDLHEMDSFLTASEIEQLLYALADHEMSC